MNDQKIKARIESIEPLTDSITQLMLQAETFIDYEAGQYLEIHLGENALAYSIANAPLGSQKYELHIRHSPDNPANTRLFSEIKNKGSLLISLPYGDCHIKNLYKEKPILFITAGTGFAPIKAIIEQLMATSDQRPFELYWGARSQSDLYMDSKVIQWQSHVKNFRYFSLYPKTKDKETLATFVLNRLGSDLNTHQFIISGPFDMVFATRDALIQGGIKEALMFSDAFSFTHKGT